MNNLMIAVSVVMPLIIYMAVGAVIKKMKLFSEEQFKSLNTVIFKIFIPLTLFFDVYEADLNETLPPDIVAFVVSGILAAYVISLLVIPKVIKTREDASTVIQGIYRSNYVLFGVSIARSLCSDNGVAQVSALAAIVVPLFNVLSVILFETRRGVNVKVSQIILNIFKNPLVQAGVLGCLLNVAGFQMPELIAAPLMQLGDIATPLALVTLGGMLSFKSILSHRKHLMIAAAGRLIILPAVMLFLAMILGYRGETLVTILAIFGSPTAVASMPMAQSMGGNGKLAGEIVAATSVFSILTIFLFVFGIYSISYGTFPH